MKNIFVLALIALVCFSCKNESKTEELSTNVAAETKYKPFGELIMLSVMNYYMKAN